LSRIKKAIIETNIDLFNHFVFAIGRFEKSYYNTIYLINSNCIYL